MRYKVAPEPVDRGVLSDAHQAVPLVPGSTDDCCARLQSRLDIESRDDASEWLLFVTALGLATETDRGYERVRTTIDTEPLGDRCSERVFGVREIVDALGDADDALTAAEVFTAVRETVPAWERNRHGNWEAVWQDRLSVLLDWAALFDLVTVQSDGSRAFETQ